MAFDAVTPLFSSAPATPADARRFPVTAGGEISMLNRIVLTLGYSAFGAAAGGAAALLLGQLAPGVVTALAAGPLIAALVVAGVCVALLDNRNAAPLLLLAVVAAAASPASVFLFSSASLLDTAAVVFVGALAAVSIVYCRKFAAAFAVAMLGLLLAAPMGAAAVVWAFGR